MGEGEGAVTSNRKPLICRYTREKEVDGKKDRIRRERSLQPVAACQSVALLRQVPVLSALSSPIRPLV